MASPAYAVGRASDLLQPGLETGGTFEDLPRVAWLRIRSKLRLSDRELAIVQGICMRQDDAAIASAMAVPENLIYRTVQRIYVKMRIGSRIELRAKVMAEFLNAADAHG